MAALPAMSETLVTPQFIPFDTRVAVHDAAGQRVAEGRVTLFRDTGDGRRYSVATDDGVLLSSLDIEQLQPIDRASTGA
jgi:hypothetical protein